MRRIVRTDLAEEDLLAIHDYIAAHNRRAADRFLDAAEKCFELIADIPGAGREWGSPRPELEGIRVYPIPRFRTYLVFYRPLRDGVLILTVIHGARDVESVLEELFPREE